MALIERTIKLSPHILAMDDNWNPTLSFMRVREGKLARISAQVKENAQRLAKAARWLLGMLDTRALPHTLRQAYKIELIFPSPSGSAVVC